MVKKLIKNEKGSGLILAILIMLNTLLIVSSISAVAIIQKKSANKQKNAPTAYQIADGGLEWAMEELKGEIGTTRVRNVPGFSGHVNHQGRVNCDFLFSSALTSAGNLSCRIYFLEQDGGGYEIINNWNTRLQDIKKIRAIGEYGEGEDWTRRGVEINFSAN